MDSFDIFDEPFFYAPVSMDQIFPSSGFAPLYEESYMNAPVLYSPQSPTPTTNIYAPQTTRMVVNGNGNILQSNSKSPDNINTILHSHVPVNHIDMPTIAPNIQAYNQHHYVHPSMNPHVNVPPQQSSRLVQRSYPPFTMLSVSPTSVLPSMKEGDNNAGDGSKKRPRKKRKKNSDALPEPTQMKNIEDIHNLLVNVNSNVFDDYITQVSKYRVLSSEETNIIKDIRRRIKNRESARKCRQNRRNKTESLEEKIKDLTEDTHKTQEDISSLKKENSCLTDEVTFLQNIINSNPVFSNIFEEYRNTPPEKRQEQLKSSINSQSFFLLAVLYSFGILYSADANNSPLFNRGFFRESFRGDESKKQSQEKSDNMFIKDTTITV